MKKLFVIFNHTLTERQIEDAVNTLGVGEIITLDEKLTKEWSMISPETSSVVPTVAPFIVWLHDQSRPGDYVLIQGEFGATWMLVKYAFEQGLEPIYSTTVRMAEEEHMVGGEVKLSHRFKHVRYRKYGE